MRGDKSETSQRRPLWRPSAWHRVSCCIVATATLLAVGAAAPSAATRHASGGAGRLWQQQQQSRVLRSSSAAAVDVPLVTGCGRGGTHATASVLQELGVSAIHEGFSADANSVSVGWPYAAPLDSKEELPWGWSPAGRYPFEGKGQAEERVRRLRHFSPVVLLVRHPLDVISSVRRCFCAKGSRNQTKNSVMNDNRSWYWVETNVNVTRFLPSLDSWLGLPHDGVLRAMTYWAGWNTLVEETHTLHLAGYDDDGGVGNAGDYGGGTAGGSSTNRSSRLERVRSSANHTVQLEDPFMPSRLAKLLNLSGAVQQKAADDHMHNTRNGKSKVSKAVREAAEVSWADLHAANGPLAQRIWAMAQRYGYETDGPSHLAKFLQL